MTCADPTHKQIPLDPNLGLATTKELMDEIVARFKAIDADQCSVEEYVIFGYMAYVLVLSQDPSKGAHLTEAQLSYRPVDN